MLEFAKKAAADQQANSQGATPAQPGDANARVTLTNTAQPPAPQWADAAHSKPGWPSSP